MNQKILFSFLLILFSIQICKSQHSLESFVKEYSKPIEQIHPNYEDFTDLEFLENVLKGKRIVLLGEDSHYNSANKEVKIRLIKFLHEKMGFEVLIHEHNMYTSNKVWEFWANGIHNDLVMKEEFRKNNMLDTSMLHLGNYIVNTLQTNSPLHYAGFDIPYYGGFSLFFEAELFQIIEKIDGERVKSNEWELYVNMHKTLIRSEYSFKKEASKKEFIKYTKELISVLERNIDNIEVDSRKVSLLAHVLKSDIALVKWIFSRPPKVSKKNVNKFIAGREKQLSDNLLWLISEYYKDKKIIVSAANFHIVRNYKFERKYWTMGHYIWEAFKEEVYSIPTLFYEGYQGHSIKQDWAIEKRPVESIEKAFHDLGYKFGFLDLSRIPQSLGPFKMMPYDEINEKMYWQEMYDGVIFIN